MTKKNKRHMHKTNDLIDLLVKMRIKDGKSKSTLLEFLMQEKGYHKQSAYRLLRQMREEIDQRSVENFAKDIKEDIERFENLYEKAIAKDNLREANNILKEISKLKGHYVERVELSGDVAIKGINVKIIKDRDDIEDVS